jgi:predicted CoA-substrate-specific enzyme activase
MTQYPKSGPLPAAPPKDEPLQGAARAPRLGIDIGADTIKAVLVGGNADRERPDSVARVQQLAVVPVRGKPFERVREILQQVRETGVSAARVGLTGSGAPQVAHLLGVEPVDEPNAVAAACNLLYPDTRTVIEMGRETQKYLRFAWDEASGRLLLDDANLSSKCAAGSGSFLDHMSRRLNYGSIAEFARVADETENPASLSGRCAVFTESDIVHLYQKGTPRERIAAGIHHAICRNYRSAIARGKAFEDQVLFIGGVSLNPAVRKYLAKELRLAPEQIVVPPHNLTIAAIGAALRAQSDIDLVQALAALDAQIERPLEYAGTEPLVRDQSRTLEGDGGNEDLPRTIALAALGVDIGSVSTKAALVTEVGGKVRILASFYRRTDGDPLAAVRDTIGQIQRQVEDAGFTIGQIVAATTGSGRYLTGDYIGADVIKNEITTQAQGARAFLPEVESILEIGGQDSKYIRLEGDVIVDFEMNKACAAGTGAFLEKQAARLGLAIADFGPTALKATRPPDLDWTCTVFSESASVYYQQNNVPIEDLCAGLCLASAKNYLHKNVASREIGETVVFQGAVAFNQGMVAAFETILRRPIVVPPYPHITGAVGAAVIAYRQRPAVSKFRGFDRIATGQYQVSSFECARCANHCDVNVFQVDGGPKYYYNDRCERYSGAHKHGLGDQLPDLFAEREQMLMAGTEAEAPEGAPTVGIPRGLMFAEYYPLYRAFFQTLGMRVLPSDPSSKEIITKGINAVAGEPCFPLKVAHGHVVQLIERGVDYIFLPGVCDTEQPNAKFRQSHTCPYVMSAPEVIAAALHLDESGPVLLRPRFFFRRGDRHLRRAFRDIGRQLGKPRSDIELAIDAGLQSLRDFRAQVEARGRGVMEALGEDQRAFIVVGRPYTNYDPAVNMDIGKKIQDLGIIAIPLDFLPLSDEDISDHWSNAYSRQIQKKLAAARLVSKDPRLRAVVLTYFACGPDSFANPFFKDEVGEPCYVMQIDEHTADAGVITRMEAFADTAAGRNGKGSHAGFTTDDTPILQLGSKRLWIPDASGAADMLSAALQAWGIDAAPLPRSADPGMNLARRAISEDVCLPMLVTTQDILERVNAPNFDPAKEAFFQGQSEGPCRFGMYCMMQRRILDKMGLQDVDIVALGNRSAHGGLGMDFLLVAWPGFLAHDMLDKMRLHTRPYEARAGTSDTIFEHYLRKACELMPHQRRILTSSSGRLRLIAGRHTRALEDLLRRAQRDLAGVPRRTDAEPRPIIGMVGEFFVRIHDGSNQEIIRKLERAGAEVWLAPTTEFFSYCNSIGSLLAADRWEDSRAWEDLRDIFGGRLMSGIAVRDEHHLFTATLPYLDGFDDIGPDELIEAGSRYIHPTFGGEAICSMGKARDFAKRHLDGIVSVAPFNCMPGMTVTMLSQAFRRHHDNIPFLNLDYDGFVDASRDAKIVSFMSQVKERKAARRGDLKKPEEVSGSA